MTRGRKGRVYETRAIFGTALKEGKEGDELTLPEGRGRKVKRKDVPEQSRKTEVFYPIHSRRKDFV